MANRKTCLVCRNPGIERQWWWRRFYRQLCPEHKRLRKRLQREAARA